MVRVRVGGVEFGGLLLLVSRECCIAFSTSAVLTVSQLCLRKFSSRSDAPSRDYARQHVRNI